MVYIEFVKNFHLADLNEVMAVRLISASSAQKTFDSYFLETVYVKFMKNFHLADSNEVMAHWGLLSLKTFDSYILDLLDVDFIKKF